MTVMKKAANGQEILFALDFDAVMAYEEAHSEWSLLTEINGMATNMRVSTLNRLCEFVGYPYRDFVALGFHVDDLADIYTKVLVEDLGFPSPDTQDSGEKIFV